MHEVLRKRGIKTPERQVRIIPPPNVWRHLGNIARKTFHVPSLQGSSNAWALERLAAMPGLNDAPLAFQVAMQIFVTETLGGRPSVFDDCSYFWVEFPGELEAIATSYVNDSNNASNNEWLNEHDRKISDRLGGTTRQQPQMNHVGVGREQTDFGIR
eukprot:51306-Pyramimonas_sp.AAC.1